MVEVPRMERILCSRWSARFVAKVFTSEEVEECEAMAHPAEGFAARFAAKEAVAKALGTGFSRGISPSTIQIQGSEKSRPTVDLSDNAKEVALSLHAGNIHVSLTHTKETAAAFAVIEKLEPGTAKPQT
jgi:holo-[acyl-carrier protein] synthase